MESTDEREEYYYQFTKRIILPCDSNFPHCLRAFIERLPIDDLEELAYDRNIILIQPYGNSFMRLDLENNRFMRELVIIFFTSNLCTLPMHEILYTIAHEFAHVFLKHPEWVDRRDDIEIEADKQVIKCGFEEELKKCDNYIYDKKK
jgi:hypothetical protein